MKHIWIFVCIILWNGVLLAREKEAYTFKNYMEMRAEISTTRSFIIAPDTGHWFPSDLKEQIDAAIEFIRANRV